MKTLPLTLTAVISAILSSTAIAGDIKPLHIPTGLANKTLPATAGQYCDVYLMNSNGARAYSSASVIDKSTVQKPKLGVKVGRWTGSSPTDPAGDCAQGTGGQTYAYHVTGGAVAYDEGAGLSTAYPHTTSNQWPLTGGSTTADNNSLMSYYSNMTYSPYYCIQVCKYAGNQHTGGATTTAGAETYDVHTHSHDAAAAGHAPAAHTAPTLSSTLCNDVLWGSCGYNY